jgi:alpha/beta superfamily hydrolase
MTSKPLRLILGTIADVALSVVQMLRDMLCNQGIATLVYNSRGVGKSTGRASWTGEPERRDYQAVVEWMVEHGESLWNGRAEEERIGKMTVLCCVSCTYGFYSL